MFDLCWYDIKNNTWQRVKSSADSEDIPARRRQSWVFVGNQFIVFGGFEGQFINQMYFGEISKQLDIEKSDPAYLEDTLKCLNNPFQSDIRFVLKHGTSKESVIYSHSFMLAHKLIGFEEVDEAHPWGDWPKLVKEILDHLSGPNKEKVNFILNLSNIANQFYFTIRSRSRCFDVRSRYLNLFNTI